MTWFKVDDGLHSHPKWLAAPVSARALWTTAGSWCAAHLTDGHVPRHVLPMLGGRPRDADDLVKLGLWDAVGDGWAFHDWVDFQPTAERVLGERAAARERQQRSRDRLRREDMSRRDSDVTHAGTNGASHPYPDPTRPDPTYTSSSSSDLRGSPQAVDNVPQETWDAYAELMLRKAGNHVDHPVPWKQTCAANAQRELGDQAARWWGDFELTPRRLAECLMDGQVRNVTRRTT